MQRATRELPRAGPGDGISFPWARGAEELRAAWELPGSHQHFPPFQALELDSIRSHHWCIQGCSAVTGDNLLPGIDWLLDDISSRIFTAD